MHVELILNSLPSKISPVFMFTFVMRVIQYDRRVYAWKVLLLQHKHVR